MNILQAVENAIRYQQISGDNRCTQKYIAIANVSLYQYANESCIM